MLQPELQESYDLLRAYLPVLVQAGATILIAFVAAQMVRGGTRRLRERLRTRTDEHSARLITLLSLGEHVARTLIVLLTIFTVLGTFGVNLAPVIASLGVVGLAISLGAQSLIKDYFGGLVILIENQYTVGDAVTIGPVSGTVERMTLRLTTLRDVNGKLHIIPNGDVRIVTNASRDWALAVVDLNLALETDLDQALDLLEDATRQAAEDPALENALLEAPKVQGWHKLLDWAVQVRLSARTTPNQRIDAEVALRRYALAVLHRGGVRLARPIERLEDRS